MGIAVFICTKRPSMWWNIIENLERQTLMPEFVVIVVNKTPENPIPLADKLRDLGIPEVLPIRVEDSVPIGTIYNVGLDAASKVDGWMCMNDDDDYYGPEYLRELDAMGSAHPEAAMIGKSRFMVKWMDGRFTSRVMGRHPFADGKTNSMAGPTMAFNTRLWKLHPEWRLKPDSLWVDVDLVQGCESIGPIYSTSEDNFRLQRYPDAHNHSWKWGGPIEG